MSTELTVLVLAALLQVLQYVLMAVPANLELGTAKTASPRDPQRLGGRLDEMVSPRTGRLFRALNNHFEGLILFTIACVAVTIGNQSSGFTAACAWIYLAARILYIPAYAFGLSPWRSLIWFAGFLATVAMLLASLF
ncbi:MAPEG family protein [Sulfitobacter sp. D35]|uniref:MAPEG family protein n=1 Tax=Sulfitobacter sp. D35 TaxID=3083252 RepID=UPI00296FBF91|nr:MAPEG family protein [Sulfitobacter sp. D35]MDW4499051.1 MAPEG family protein [Sulfitobacter sp. D35]